DRNDPQKTGKPFFVWYNPARMHITTVLSDKYMAMVGQPGGKDVLLLLRQGPFGGPIQELEDVLRDGVRLTGGLRYGRGPLPLDSGRQRQTRSLRDFRRPATQDSHGCRRGARRTRNRVPI